jgi:uncharacterized protein
MPGDLKAGIRVDSVLKRVMFAFETKDLTAFLFSRYINHDETRVHIRRTPMRRASSLAPFLFLDSNNHAFIADKRVQWMINGLTTTEMYPYAFREILGDKAEERAVDEFPERRINYAEDSVKVVILRPGYLLQNDGRSGHHYMGQSVSGSFPARVRDAH